jgi:hypothetical protein
VSLKKAALRQQVLEPEALAPQQEERLEQQQLPVPQVSAARLLRPRP